MALLYRRLCARCLAIGARNREFYLSFGVPEQRIFSVPYAVDNAFFMGRAGDCVAQRAAIRSEFGAPQQAPMILFASKLTPRKRPQDLLRAYQNLRQRGLEAALVFVGSGEQEQSLRQFVAAHHVPDVFFLGFRNQSELPCLYAAADIFVLPSENEPWGLIINEVMCAGLPVVASDEIGAAPDLVHHGDNGFTFPAGDVVQLADRLATLVEDVTLRRRMGQRSLELIRTWNLDRCAEGVAAALRSLKTEARDAAHA
jgi:glycosyltransferase involved in cell wall biosynthesis